MEISVIITHYNRPYHLNLVLDSLENQTLDPSLYEVLVIDSGSQTKYIDDLRLMSWHKSYPFRFSVLQIEPEDKTKKLKVVAANLAARGAGGNTLLFCDQDTFLPRNFLEKHLAWQQQFPTGNLLATSPLHCMTRPITMTRYRYYQGLTGAGLKALQNSEELLLDSTPRMQYTKPTGDYFIASLFSIQRDRFWAIGAFDEVYAQFESGPEDLDIFHAFVRAPQPKFVCIPDTACFHFWHEPASVDKVEAEVAWAYFHDKYGLKT